MKLKEWCSLYFRDIQNLHIIRKEINDPGCAKDRLSTELIRNTHSIEKGLSLKDPRPGFGRQKLKNMMTYIPVLAQSNQSFHKQAVQMALDCMRSYTQLQRTNNTADELTEEVERFLLQYPSDHAGSTYGGTKTITKEELTFDQEEIERFFRTRHSVRDFSGEPVDPEIIRKAIALAQTAPSACNRQGYRCYVITGHGRKEMQEWLHGVGGVQEAEGTAFILVTSKLSAYREGEAAQHPVSASIFAGYLALTLHLYGLGVCILQRSVSFSPQFHKLRSVFGAGADEHPVVVLCAGNLKEEFTVPVSHRMNPEDIAVFLK